MSATLPSIPAVTATRPAVLLTAADLAAFPTELPSGSVRWELFDGELVAMSPPGEIHGRRQAKVVSALDAVAETALGLGRVWGEVGIVLRRGPDRVVGADAAFVLTRSLPVRRSREGYLDTIPELVVEVVSKNDTGPEVRDKVAEYLAAGVRMVWKLEPDAQTVTVHRPDQPDEVFGPADTLACPDLLPGFAVPVAKLFPAD